MLLPLTKAYSIAVTRTAPVVGGLNDFGFDLYRIVGTPNNNVILSPYGLSALMGLLAQGAEGDTETQLMQMLHLDDVSSNDSISKALANIGHQLTAKSCSNWFTCQLDKWLPWRKSSMWTSANALWASSDLLYKKSFLTATGSNPAAHFYTVNFAGAPEKARSTINRWVKKETQGGIQDLIASGQINAETRLVLTNALYFKGQWAFPFKKEETKQQAFTLESGKQVDASMMHHQGKMLYSENDKWQMVQLPYKGTTLAMLVILPKPKVMVKDVQQMMNMQRMLQLFEEAYQTDVMLSLPKFSIQSTFNELTSALQTLGLRDAFTKRANFSGISDESLVISI